MIELDDRPSAPHPHGRFVVREIVVGEGCTQLLGLVDGAAAVVSIAEVPSAARADRWRTELRQVSHLEVLVGATTSSATCRAHGRGHRRPIERFIPLAAGLGLRQRGVPMIVDVR
ncbi:MAG: hypothetical protein AAGA99_08115 [Actinomycetota bacterium]